MVDANSPDIGEIVIARIMAEKLHRCLAKLPIAEQELLKSLYFEGMSERKLAKQIGMHYMTIHDRKVRALKKLKK